MTSIDFQISIYKSLSHRGQYAVAISNQQEAALVLGFTSDLDKTQQAFSSLLNVKTPWEHDETTDYHSLRVPVVNA